MKRVEPRTPRAKCHRRIPKPQKKRKMHRNMHLLSLLASFPDRQNWKTSSTIDKALDVLWEWKINNVAIPHHLPCARYSMRRVSGGTLFYSFQPPCEVTEKKTGFQRDKQYDKVQRRKVVGFIKFPWMTRE